MTKEVYRSKCCNAKVKASGIPDFLGSNDVCTVNYVCLKCNKSCDVVASKGQKQKVCVEKSGMIKLSVNDDIEIRLTREGRRIYKEYRKKYIHDPFKRLMVVGFVVSCRNLCIFLVQECLWELMRS